MLRIVVVLAALAAGYWLARRARRATGAGGAARALVWFTLAALANHALMEAWKAAAQRTLPERAWGERRWFAAAARALHATGVRVDLRRRWLGRGYLVVGVP